MNMEEIAALTKRNPTRGETLMPEESLILQRPRERVLTRIEDAKKLAQQNEIMETTRETARIYFTTLEVVARRYYKLEEKIVRTMPSEEFLALEQIIYERARRHWILRKTFLPLLWSWHALLWIKDDFGCEHECSFCENDLFSLFKINRAFKRLVGGAYFPKLLEARERYRKDHS